jgi:Xaa-Pro aminopeptidase
MDQDGIDCLIVPPSGGLPGQAGAASRYLTHVGGGGADVSVVFPLHREPAAIAPDAGLWSAAQPWCTDLREPAPSHSSAALIKLKDVTLRRRKIGIVGMAEASVAFVKGLQEAYPRITFLDFTPQLDGIRLVKSDEEIAFLKRSAQIVDGTYRALADEMQVGVPERQLFAAAAHALSAMGSELPIRIRWASGEQPGRLGSRPRDQNMERGGLLLTDIEAAWGGYRARGSQPLACGEPTPEYADLSRCAIDLWNKTLRDIQPNMRLDGVLTPFRAKAAQLSPSASGGGHRLLLRGCGLGRDWPRIGGDEVGEPDLTLTPGCCFTMSVILESGPRWIQWSEPVVMTERGTRRLGSTEQRLRALTE